MPSEGNANGGSLSLEVEYDMNPGTLRGRRGLRASLSGDAKWLDGGRDSYQGQLKVTLPLFEGIEIPITMTVADRTMNDDSAELRGGVSFAVDTALVAELLMRGLAGR